ncbi:hypothetical protein [Streptococcus lactarius]|uniref:hypothetical protein n=1 Tax=Streptococcus lactarius TaxID=684066 RepID=UPI00362025F5
MASKSINEAEFKARLTESQEHVAQLVNEVESYRSVLESDKDLKDLLKKSKIKGGE